MDDQVQRLVDKVWDKFLQTPLDRRFMVGVGGIPGSGKTTLSRTVTALLNARHSTQDSSHPSYAPGPVAAFVPMDGYHLTRAQLSAMPDPATAHARRGAEFTFDGASFLRLTQSLRKPLPSPSTTTAAAAAAAPPDLDLPGSAPTSSPAGPRDYPPGTIFAPSFDHAVKDPKEDDIPILPSHRIVVFEGNYVALDREPWRSAAKLMDEIWFVDVDFAVARRRLVKRHVEAGIAEDAEDADRRAMENDLPNGEDIVAMRLPVDEVILSGDDRAWVHN